MTTSNINIIIVSNDDEYKKAMQIRRNVFIDEYKIDETKEYDGNDYCATHILALNGDKPIGTMRIRYFNDFVKMERMCVAKDYRKTDISEQIMQKAMLFCAQKGYKKAYGVCKKELLNRWKRNGFEVVPNANVCEQNGMTLVPVCCTLPKVENVVTMQSEADVLNTKEGDWFESTTKQMISRLQNLTAKVKQSREGEGLEIVESSKIKEPILHKTNDKSY